MDDNRDRWPVQEVAESNLPSTSSAAGQTANYPVVSPSHSLYPQYPATQSLDNGYHGFQLLVNQAGLYQPVRYDGISSSDGTQAMPVDLPSSVGQGNYVAVVAPPVSMAHHHYNVVNAPRSSTAADTHSHPFTMDNRARSYALSQATTSVMSSSSVDNVQLYSNQNETGSSEAIPLVSHSSIPQEGVISSIAAGNRIHPIHQEYSSNEPDTTQDEDIEQTLSSDPDLSLETSDSGVDSGPSSTVLVPEPMPAPRVMPPSNLAAVNIASTSVPLPSTSGLNPLQLALEVDAGISSSQQIGVAMDTSGGSVGGNSSASQLVNVSSGMALIEPQEPSTSGTVDDSLENGVQDSRDDDSQSSLTLPLFADNGSSLARSRSKRRSTRMSSLTVDGAETVARAKYVPTPYNPSMMWCNPCQKVYPSECPEHPVTYISDKVVLSRAWSSLPAQLTVFRVTEGSDLGVFAKKTIHELTQFGPYVAELVESKDQLTKRDFILQVDREDGVHYIEASDENACNWMMFVRPASSYADQNLVAFQQGTDIFFVTTREIDAKQELRVGYSAHYANHIGAEAFTVKDEDIATIIEQEAKWSCYECSKQFMTSAQLQAHLSVHDEPTPGPSEPGGESGVYEPDYFPEEGERRAGRRRLTRFGRARGRAGKKGKDRAENFQSWKKKKTSLYLSSRIKRYPTKQPFRSLYKKREADVNAGQTSSEWMCVHCDLTFDDPSLLNLHTLTHAAEDVGRDEMDKLGQTLQTEDENPGSSESVLANVVGLDIQLQCPVCARHFPTKKDLIEHASEHARMRSTRASQKAHKCTKCWKSFDAADRLQKHMLCHGSEESKPKQCSVCHKRFMNNSALSCHMKVHSEFKYYQCMLCKEDFSQAYMLKRHVVSHEVNGQYSCTSCEKTFDDYLSTKKHIRAFHSEKRYPCSECDKVFPRPDKLKLHMLRHSNHREFMCETCGRQFKRKDKLKEHMSRMHTEEKMMALATRPPRPATKKFIPKVSPMDFHRFIYKCHACMLGFKRRGMLVNHLAKRHPDTKPDAVPELNLPILRTQKDYYCQYCDKVYKSSSKRKAHILKNHPGAELPASARGKVEMDVSQLPNPTFSQTVGSVTTIPHPCVYCHKQYASKAKLLQHQRKKHPDVAPPPHQRHKVDLAGLQVAHSHQPQQQQQQQHVIQEQAPVQEITVHQVVHQEQMPGADLLTQAMSELTQTLQDYRQVEYHGMRVINVAHAGQPAMLQQVAPPQPTHSTIELSHLGQGIVQAHYPQPPPQHHQQQQARESPTITSAQPMSPQQALIVSTNQQQIPVTMPTTSAVTYMPGARWNGYNTNYR